MRLSENFTLHEFTRSKIADDNGLKNIPSSKQQLNIEQLCIHVLEPIRKLLNRKILISSGFRNNEVNILAGGVNSSHHLCNNFFAAADINAEGIASRELFEFICNNSHLIPFEQCINEFGRWVHISYRRGKSDALIASKENGKTVYIPAQSSTLV